MNGYTCTTCNIFHPFSTYIKAHIHETLRHTCRVCGAVHSLRDYDIRVIIPGKVGSPVVSLCSEQPIEGMKQLSMWYGAEVIPPQPGFYECRFKHVIGFVRLRWTGQQWAWGVHPVEVERLEAWRAQVIV